MMALCRENGPVENLTLVMYIVSIACILYSGRSILTVKTRVAITVVLGYMFMREADLHKSISTQSILKSKFWLSSQIPLTDKLLALAILVPIFLAVFYLISKYVRKWWQDLCHKDSYAVGILVFLVALVISKIFDRSLNMMTEIWGWRFETWVYALVSGQEEFLECILPLLLMVSFYQYRETYSTFTRGGERARHAFVSVWLSLLASFTALLCWIVLPVADMLAFVEEGGVVETLTLVAYVIAIIGVVLYGKAVRLSTRSALVVVLVYMFMREADWHKSISTQSILKSKFWLGSQIPVTDKLLAVVILLPIFCALLWLVLKRTKNFFWGLFDRQAWAISVFCFLALLCISKSIDRSLSVLAEMLYTRFPGWLIALQVSQEEFMEFMLPVLVLVAVLQYGRERMNGFSRY